MFNVFALYSNDEFPDISYELIVSTSESSDNYLETGYCYF
jgi:hypothetical protein